MDNYEGLICFFKEDLYRKALRYNKDFYELENQKTKLLNLGVTKFDDEISKMEKELYIVRNDICLQAEILGIDPNLLFLRKKES